MYLKKKSIKKPKKNYKKKTCIKKKTILFCSTDQFEHILKYTIIFLNKKLSDSEVIYRLPFLS